METLAPGMTLRGYRVEARLGGGGQAVTWRGTVVADGRAVVLKQFRLALAADWKGHALFLRECATLRSLSHPAIPAYVDAFEAVPPGGDVAELFLVQAFVDAQNLATLIREGRRWSEPELSTLAQQALDVLAWLHARNPPIIHRDIKPSNLLLRPGLSGLQPALALIDFTAVTAMTHDAEDGGSTVVGTHGYMPPEQLLGRAGAASDLYALGMTLVHLASGRHPGSLPLDGLRRDLRGVLNLTSGFEAWLERLVDPDPRGRPESAVAARRALDEALKPRRPARAKTSAWLEWQQWIALGGLAVVVLLALAVAPSTGTKVHSPKAPAPRAEAPVLPKPPRTDSALRDLEVDVDVPEGLRVTVQSARLRPGDDTFRESEVAIVYTLTNTGSTRLGVVELRVVLAGTGVGARQVHDLEPVSLLRVPLEAGEVRVEDARLHDVARNTRRARLSFQVAAAGPEVPPVTLTPATFASQFAMPEGTSLRLMQRRTWLIAEGLSDPTRAFDFELRLTGVERLFAVTLVQTCLDSANGALYRRNDRDFTVVTEALGAPSLNNDELATFRVLCPEAAASVSWSLGNLNLRN